MRELIIGIAAVALLLLGAGYWYALKVFRRYVASAGERHSSLLEHANAANEDH